MRWGFTPLVFAVVLCCAARAQAHPLGNFTINHLTKVSVDARTHALTLRYVLDIAEIPTFQIMRERNITGPGDAKALAAWADAQIAIVKAGLAVSAEQVAAVFAQYGLEKKTARSRSARSRR